MKNILCHLKLLKFLHLGSETFSELPVSLTIDTLGEELSKPNPKKSLLKTLWKGTLDALPTLAQMSSVVSLIVKLFS